MVLGMSIRRWRWRGFQIERGSGEAPEWRIIERNNGQSAQGSKRPSCLQATGRVHCRSREEAESQLQASLLRRRCRPCSVELTRHTDSTPMARDPAPLL